MADISKKLDLLVDVSSQIQLKNHFYLEEKNQQLYFSKNKGDFSALQALIEQVFSEQILNDALKDEKKEVAQSAVVVDSCLAHIESHLSQKAKRLRFRWLCPQKKKENFQQRLNYIKGKREELRSFVEMAKEGEDESKSSGENEAHARLLFYKTAAPQLKIKRALLEEELNALKLISLRVWQSQPQFAAYRQTMRAIFQGEHVLIAEKEGERSLYADLIATCRPQVRTSSHYRAHPDLQYEICGPQTHTVLFGKASLALNAAAKAKPQKSVSQEKPQPFTWFQFERSRDSKNPLNRNFWKHRVRDFTLYWVLKNIFKDERPNIGPYGRGHGDQMPTILY